MLKNPCIWCPAKNISCHSKNCSEYIDYLEKRKKVTINYHIGLNPLGIYQGSIEVWEGLTKEEIEKAIFDDCKFHYKFNYKKNNEGI